MNHLDESGVETTKLSGLVRCNGDLLQRHHVGCGALLGDGLLSNVVKARQHSSMNDGCHRHSEGDSCKAGGVRSGHFNLQSGATVAR